MSPPSGIFLPCSAITSASLRVATEDWRRVTAPHTRNRRSIRAIGRSFARSQGMGDHNSHL